MKKISSFIKLACLAFVAMGAPLGAQLSTQTFSYTGTIQTFTVPPLCVNAVTIEARGAQGGDNVTLTNFGGKGAQMIGTFTASPGQVLNIIVGQRGANNTGGNSANGAGGGGGGSFVWVQGQTVPLIVAGGGGGSSLLNNGVPNYYGKDASITTTGTGSRSHDVFSNSPGGTNGANGTSVCGSGGKGWTAVLANPAGNPAGNVTYGAAGGYGGGGGAGTIPNGTSWNYLHTAGGGGGYSGGGAGGTDYYHGGGGGGSYNAGTNQVNTASVQVGNGLVTISYVGGSGVTAVSSSTVICAGGSATLTASGVPTYSWSNTATTNSIVVSPVTTTTYAVVGTNTANCSSTVVLTVNVNTAVPSLTISNSAAAFGGICPNTSATITASGALTYTWNNSISNGVSFQPTSTNTYIVTGENACGTSTAATSISIHPLPTVTGVASQPTICSGNPVTLTGVGNATNYVWNGTVANGTNWFPSVTTTYTVVGTSAQSCTNSILTTVTVVTTPVAPPIASPALICIGSTATLSSTGATNYTWTTPTGTFGTSNISVSPVVSTTYILTKANSNCVNTQTVGVIVNNLPNVFAIVTPTLICASNQATLQGAGAATYTWMAAGPPVFTTTGSAPVVSPSITTLYTVTASDGTCVNTATVLLSTNPNPTITISPTSTMICRGQNVTLNANGAIGYSWTTVGITSNTNAASITETPVNSTLYQVIGENSFSCTSGAQQVVIVNNTPTLTVNASKPLICANAPVNLSVSVNQQPPTTYQWDANANNATTSVTTVSPPVTTIYTVTGTYVSTQCSSTKTILVTVFLPTFAVNSPTSSCLGGTINLIASGANSYTWNGNQPFSQIAVSPPTATVYMVAATSVSAGVSCVSTNSAIVSIYNNPTVTAAPQRTLICKGEVTNLVGNGAVNYLWSTSQTGSAVPVNPLANTTYTVEGVDQNGCKGTASTQLKVSTCIGINEVNSGLLVNLSVFPNPSTGQLTVKGDHDMTLHLVNELGQVIKVLTLDGRNDHQCEVSGLAQGVYFLSDPESGQQLSQKILVQH